MAACELRPSSKDGRRGVHLRIAAAGPAKGSVICGPGFERVNCGPLANAGRLTQESENLSSIRGELVLEREENFKIKSFKIRGQRSERLNKVIFLEKHPHILPT